MLGLVIMGPGDMTVPPLPADLEDLVARSLAEDLGDGDITAALIPSTAMARAELLVREAAVLCGSAWFDAVFRRLDPRVEVAWRFADGDDLAADSIVCTLGGPARALLSGERTALNLLQTLSGTATAARRYAEAVRGTRARILDTRKTLPGLRLAQKYAVRCGGAMNHRIGLFDAVLIKENHIAAAGGLGAAVDAARTEKRGVMIEAEVETLAELEEGLESGADRLLLDNFTLSDMRAAVRLRNERAPSVELEASGGIGLEGIRDIASTGVEYISVGAVTKHLQAVDYSMRFAPVR